MANGSRKVWAERVARWNASGLTAAEFARRHDVVEGSLKWWKWKLGSLARAQTKTATPMSPMTFVEMTSPARRDSLAVVLESGVQVQVPADFDEATLARLLDALERRR